MLLMLHVAVNWYIANACCTSVGVKLSERGLPVKAYLLALHADNEAAQIAAGVTTSSGTQFCRLCNTTKDSMFSVPEYAIYL